MFSSCALDDRVVVTTVSGAAVLLLSVPQDVREFFSRARSMPASDHILNELSPALRSKVPQTNMSCALRHVSPYGFSCSPQSMRPTQLKPFASTSRSARLPLDRWAVRSHRAQVALHIHGDMLSPIPWLKGASDGFIASMSLEMRLYLFAPKELVRRPLPHSPVDTFPLPYPPPHASHPLRRVHSDMYGCVLGTWGRPPNCKQGARGGGPVATVLLQSSFLLLSDSILAAVARSVPTSNSRSFLVCRSAGDAEGEHVGPRLCH